jgi:hypothetical protein
LNLRFRKYLTVIILLLKLTHGFSQTKQSLVFSEGLAPQKKDLKEKKSLYGFVNSKGKIVIPHNYDTVFFNFKYGLAAVGKNTQAGVIDKKGKIVIPFEYKETGEVTKTFIPVKNQKGLWGFYDHAGEKISAPLFQNYRIGTKGKIIVQKDGKWGVINEKGEVVLDFNYKGIQVIGEKNYEACRVTKWTVRSNKNETLLSLENDSLRYAGEGLYKISMIGVQSLIDSKGKVIVTGYDEINVFQFGLSKAKIDNYGVINASGKIVIPFIYDDVIIDDSYIRVKLVDRKGVSFKEKWGLYDHKGNLLIRPKYSKMNESHNGLIAAMREDGTWGYVSATGSTEIIFRYEYAEDFKDGLARVRVPYWLSKKDLYAIIDKSGEYVISPADYNMYESGLIRIDKFNKPSLLVSKDKYSSFDKVGSKFVRVFQNGKYGMINAEGREIISPVYDYVSAPSSDGIIIVEKDGKSGIVDSRGVFTFNLSNRFEKIYGFKEGFSKFLLKGKYGFMDRYGNVYISPQYPETGEMSDSMVNVVIKGKWGYLDFKENLKVQPYYEQALPFENGTAIVKENGKWNLINKDGRQLHKNDLDTIVKKESGRYQLVLNKKFGLANTKGKEIIAPKYEAVVEIGKNMIKVKKNGLWGVLDLNENFILPIEFDIIFYEPFNNTFITGTFGKQEQIHIK